MFSKSKCSNLSNFLPFFSGTLGSLESCIDKSSGSVYLSDRLRFFHSFSIEEFWDFFRWSSPIKDNSKLYRFFFYVVGKYFTSSSGANKSLNLEMLRFLGDSAFFRISFISCSRLSSSWSTILSSSLSFFTLPFCPLFAIALLIYPEMNSRIYSLFWSSKGMLKDRPWPRDPRNPLLLEDLDDERGSAYYWWCLSVICLLISGSSGKSSLSSISSCF